MNRSKDTIIPQILGICIEGAYRRKIMHQANLNIRTVNLYIELLTGSGMIDANNENMQARYKTTDRGLELLDNYRQVQDMLLPDAENKNAIKAVDF
ncbi:MAG: winged helix-turn-helix domain-containing protein [Methanotrichaceae archaeon]|jgi:predicted transcriptional regulator